MHDVLIAILVLLGAALVLGALAERLRQTAVLGYLVAGTVVGPGALGWVRAGDGIDTLAELGAATLLFSIGTEFSVARLRAMGARVFLTGALQVAVTVLAGLAASAALGLAPREAFAVGAVVSLSSTAVVMRLLVEQRTLDSVQGRLSMGVLLTQDVAVVPLVIAVTIAAGDSDPAHAAATLGRTAGLAALLGAGLFVLVRGVFPRFLAGPGIARNRELVAVFAAVCAVGSALGAEAAGLSPALGAFVAGVLLGSSPFATQVRAELAPLRTLLITLFFAAVGLAGDPTWMWEHAGQASAVIVAVVAGKALLAAAVARAAGSPTGISLAAGLCLAQVGEFSFVIAEVARAGGLLPGDTHRMLVTATIGSLALAPFLVSASRRVVRIGGEPPATAQRPASGPGGTDGHAIDLLIVGFGPAAQHAFARLPHALRARTAVIDSNAALASLAGSLGARAHIGDAGRVDVLEHAGIRGARVVAVTPADVDVVRHVAALAASLAPAARVIARSRYHATAADVARAGTAMVIDEEALVGDRIAAAIGEAVHIDAAGRAPVSR